ncbi:uncharacterized protein LOC135955394 [Calliphora vicina]|uniref:uncharacterized protein LOC135955394 n=1 Tax=Calliphora vicina TaxID=7373 RepID=UPI00325BD5A6
MSNKLVVGLFLCYILNIIEIFANPIDIPNPNLSILPNQLFNNSYLLAYQGFELKENQNPTEAREKRFLDDLYYIMYYLYDDDDDDDENDDSSSEEDSNDDKVGKGKYDLCHNCTVNYNKINQVQHIHQHGAPPSNSTISNANNKIEIKEPSIPSITEQNLQPPIKKPEETIETTAAAIPENTATNPTNTAVVPVVTEKTDESAVKATTIKTAVVPTVTEKTDESAVKATTIKTEAETVKAEAPATVEE